MADFCMVSSRALDPFAYKVFKYHYLLGADWKLCCRQLGMERGNFFHIIYAIEQKLGRVFATLKPYGLYPLSDYFGGTVHVDIPVVLPAPTAPAKHILRPPVVLPLAA